MTDREMLHLAAKAAGYEYGIIHDAPRIKCDAGWTPWNPLDDDGDAFRLMVKLCMSVTNTTKRTSILTRPDPEFGDWIADSEPHLDDPLAATRLAIVRAAAEIGKGMK